MFSLNCMLRYNSFRVNSTHDSPTHNPIISTLSLSLFLTRNNSIDTKIFRKFVNFSLENRNGLVLFAICQLLLLLLLMMMAIALMLNCYRPDAYVPYQTSNTRTIWTKDLKLKIGVRTK